MHILVFLSQKGAVLHMREIVIRVYFLHPVTFFIAFAPVEIAPFDRFPVLWLKRRASVTATPFL